MAVAVGLSCWSSLNDSTNREAKLHSDDAGRAPVVDIDRFLSD